VNWVDSRKEDRKAARIKKDVRLGAQTRAVKEEPFDRDAICDGGQRRNRTADASLFRAALYQLSYLAISGWTAPRRARPDERCEKKL
jgi:hypothetical protein